MKRVLITAVGILCLQLSEAQPTGNYNPQLSLSGLTPIPQPKEWKNTDLLSPDEEIRMRTFRERLNAAWNDFQQNQSLAPTAYSPLLTQRDE